MGPPITTGRHTAIRITQCYLPPDTSERAWPVALTPASKPVLDLPTPEG